MTSSMNVLKSAIALVILAALGGRVAAQEPLREAAPPPLTGLNIAGGEFGHPGGRYGFDYIYPSQTELAFVAAHGFSVIRLPFQWERLQPHIDGLLDGEELRRLQDVVLQAKADGLSVILDPHNYARYFDQTIGSPQVPIASFAQFWHELAVTFRGDPHVIFGLMNEPHDMPTETWAAAAAAAIIAIRGTGAENLILVPGNAYSGAHGWAQSYYGTPNAVVMRGLKDPCNNMAFEFHQYLDANFSGMSPACPAPLVVIDALRNVTNWLRETGNKGFLGEFAASARPECVEAMGAMLQFMAEHADDWLGWTYWAAGAWWPPEYMFAIAPRAGVDRPQLAVLQAWRGKGGLPPHVCHSAGYRH
jgi:endoglucanase